jgi:hypothetical protein
MKTLIDRVIQYSILAASTAVALLILMPLVKAHYPAADEKVLVPLTAGLIYVMLLTVVTLVLKIERIRAYFDPKSVFVGQYLSCQQNPDRLGIFEIRFDVWKNKYKLKGTTYSLSSARSTGGWSSDLLDMNPELFG